MGTLLCCVRFLMRNRFLLDRRPWISGHDMIEQPAQRGQPACVHVMECNACGKPDVVWGACIRCGNKEWSQPPF